VIDYELQSLSTVAGLYASQRASHKYCCLIADYDSGRTTSQIRKELR